MGYALFKFMEVLEMKKKTVSLILILCMLISMITAVPAAAATSGTCGKNLTWTLDDDGTFTISGIGTMYDYSKYSMP